ncbi:hypothetical protein FRC08_000015 [Ceratobasidium sp. 394]|nr:hypothetical protein FRC08_000015 [Ceratobasidium sp. 394]
MERWNITHRIPPVMATSLFDSAPEYDSDLDTLADFVLEPTTAHVPPPPSPAPNTCLCGRTTRDDEADDHLYCSEACARLDAFHALTARSRSNSLAPTPATTAPPTPLGLYTPLRESLAILHDSTSTPPYAATPLSASSSHTSFESVGLPIEMSSHYRRVHAKRERMERRASKERERSRSHSRSHSKARPSLSSLREEIHVETLVEREAGDDGEDHVPAPAALFVHVAVNVQVQHHDADDATSDAVLPSFGPAPGLEWRNPFADPSPESPLSSHDPSVAPHDVANPSTDDLLSITESELSPFIAYAPVPGPPPGLRTRKSSVCFAGVDPAAGVGAVHITRSRAPSNPRSRASSISAFAAKPLPPTPASMEPSAPPELCERETSAQPLEPIPLRLDSPFQPASASQDAPAEPTTPTSPTVPASPRTPNARIHVPEADPPTPSRSAPATGAPPSPATPKHSPPASVPRMHKPQALDALARAKIFSMVIDPELDVFSAQVVDQVAPLKRSETAPELNMGWVQPAMCYPQTPRKESRTRATSTPRRGAGGRPRTTSTPAHPQLGALQFTPRRARVHHIPPPTPPVSPSQVSSPRPVIGQDPGSWPSFGAAFDAWDRAGEMHRRQESGESTGSSATDVSWESGSAVTEPTEYWRGRAQSPATSSVRTIVPPPRGSSLVRCELGEKDQHVPRRTRRHSSIAALDSILAMEDTFWATEGPVVVREADDGEGEGVPAGQFSTKAGVVGQFSGDAGGFAFPSGKPKPAFEPVLRIAGVSRPPSMLNPSPPRSRRGSGVRFDPAEHAHRLTASHFPVSPSVGRPSPEGGEPSPIPAHLHLAGSLFDGPVTGSPLLLSARGSPALPNASPISAHFGLRASGSPYLSVGRRGSRSTDASSVLLRTASAARLAAALNAAPDNDDDEEELARFGTRVRRSGSLGHSSPRIGLGLALGDEPVRTRANSESWSGSVPGTMSRSGSRMNLMNPTTSVVEEEEEEDYGQVVDSSRFSGIVVEAPASSLEQASEASPLIDAFPHPMGGYFPGSRFASRAGTPVRSLHTSNSALSLRQLAASQVQPTEREEDEDEDEEIVTTVQRMRHSMQLLATA